MKWLINKIKSFIIEHKAGKFFSDLRGLFYDFSLSSNGSCIFINRYFPEFKIEYKNFLEEKFADEYMATWSIDKQQYMRTENKWNAISSLKVCEKYCNLTFEELGYIRQGLLIEFFKQNNRFLLIEIKLCR